MYRRTVQVIGERRQATALRGGQFRHVHRPDASTDQSVATQQPRARLRTSLLPTSSLNQWWIPEKKMPDLNCEVQDLLLEVVDLN